MVIRRDFIKALLSVPVVGRILARMRGPALAELDSAELICRIEVTAGQSTSLAFTNKGRVFKVDQGMFFTEES